MLEVNLNPQLEKCEEIITDSLWIFPKRDNYGVHTGQYHGNFIPQIPRQAMLRYTRKGDIVLDTFLGSGTTLIECKYLDRHGIGIELVPEIAKKAEDLINRVYNPYVKTKVIVGDSTERSTFKLVREYLKTEFDRERVQLIIMHPPYHDIIKFSEDPRDLSNAGSLDDFLSKFGKVVENSYDLLDHGRFLVLVMGDKYTHGEWIPLGFLTMNEVLKRGYKLKSIVVKNIEGNRGKWNSENLWRYRALMGGFYIFKHEYIFFFVKNGS
jgi:hypothetical protein